MGGPDRPGGPTAHVRRSAPRSGRLAGAGTPRRALTFARRSEGVTRDDRSLRRALGHPGSGAPPARRGQGRRCIRLPFPLYIPACTCIVTPFPLACTHFPHECTHFRSFCTTFRTLSLTSGSSAPPFRTSPLTSRALALTFYACAPPFSAYARPFHASAPSFRPCAPLSGWFAPRVMCRAPPARASALTAWPSSQALGHDVCQTVA
jgi:hypothetical protein